MADYYLDGPAGEERDEELTRLREALETKTRVLEAQADRYLRTVADSTTARRPAARVREDYPRFANESLLRDLLPVLDNLDRALAAARTEPTAAVTAGVELLHSAPLPAAATVGPTPP